MTALAELRPAIQYPLTEFSVGEQLKLKGRHWTISDIRNRLGMILTPSIGVNSTRYWTVGELLPLRGYWYRVAIVGHEGFVLNPKEPIDVDE